MFTITHELRTPLSAITGYADLLGSDTDTEKREEYTATIRQASERMASQLNTLLSFFRLDCGKEEINLAPFRLGDIVRTLEAEFRPQMEVKGLLLEVDGCEDSIVMSDKERVILNGLLRLQLIDEIILYTVPFIAGTGRHLFKANLPTSHWSLVKKKEYNGGILRTVYRKKHIQE